MYEKVQKCTKMYKNVQKILDVSYQSVRKLTEIVLNFFENSELNDI